MRGATATFIITVMALATPWAMLSAPAEQHAKGKAAADWYPSRYGADDTLGAINSLSPAKVLEAAMGSDSWAIEVIFVEHSEILFPVHLELLVKNGVYILENMDTRALAVDQANKVLFALGQPRFVGAVQAVINPVAIR